MNPDAWLHAGKASPVGTFRWPAEAAAQFAPENGIDVSQVPVTYSVVKWLWRCAKGHVWRESAYDRNDGKKKTALWRRRHGIYSCRTCVIEEHGHRYSCGHIEPRLDLLGSTLLPPLCSACTPVLRWMCGRESRHADPTRVCSSCNKAQASLTKKEYARRLIEEHGLVPHGPGKAIHCGAESHDPYIADWRGVALGYGCRRCWKTNVSGGARTPPGNVLRVSRHLPTSKMEERVRTYLTKQFERVADPTNANAVSISGTLYDRPEVTPDILIVGEKIAVEVDGEGHRGARELADRLKDEALRNVGWKVVRLRLRGLKPLDSANANVVGRDVTNSLLDELVDVIRDLMEKPPDD